jgi:uncharacterized protein (TIGR02231 family)
MRALTLFAACCCALSVARADETPPISAESRITAVTVYGDRADVRRLAEDLSLRSGVSVIRIAGLPTSMDPSSVRASGTGEEKISIVNVDVKRAWEPSAPPEGLRLELEELEGGIREWEARKAGLDAGQEFLESIRLSRSEESGPLFDLSSAGPEVLSGTLAFLTEEVGNNRRQAFEATEELGRLKTRARALRREIDSHGASRDSKWNVDVELDAAAATRCDLIVEYTTRGAGWTAEYDVVVSEDLKSIEIVYTANVSQHTGEDWDGVAVSLSSAQPALGARLPSLSPWWLEVPRPPIARPAGTTPKGERPYVRGGRSSEIRTVVDGMPVASSIRTIGTQSQGRLRHINTTEEAIAVPPSVLRASGVFATSFEIAARQNLPSDRRSRRLRITSVDVDGEIRHESVPKLAPHVFLIASVRNSSDYPMLAGPSRILLGGNFLGRGEIENVAPGQEFDLSLGVDRAVTVERKVARRQDDESGSRHESEIAYALEVANHRDVPVKVTLRDQIPISPDKDVSVRLRKAEPELVSKPDDDGFLEWTQVVPPGDRQTTTFRYEVKYPAGRRPPNL